LPQQAHSKKLNKGAQHGKVNSNDDRQHGARD
jgi:hypothetical protein